MEGKGVVIVKEDSLLASRLHSIIPRSLRCLLSEVAISQLRLTPRLHVISKWMFDPTFPIDMKIYVLTKHDQSSSMCFAMSNSQLPDISQRKKKKKKKNANQITPPTVPPLIRTDHTTSLCH